MKITTLFLGIFLIPLLNYAQANQPDTLQLDIKPGQKIILIGEDLNSFKTVNTDSIIQKALLSVKDSLAVTSPGQQIARGKYRFVTDWTFGAGSVTDRISPFMGFVIELQRTTNIPGKGKPLRVTYFYNVSLNAFYSFEKNVGAYNTYTNVFAEASTGHRLRNNTYEGHYLFDELSYGVGYLVKREGDYFGKHTIKLFGAIMPNNSFIRIKPELYITNNFRKAFPGISLIVTLAR